VRVPACSCSLRRPSCLQGQHGCRVSREPGEGGVDSKTGSNDSLLSRLCARGRATRSDGCALALAHRGTSGTVVPGGHRTRGQSGSSARRGGGGAWADRTFAVRLYGSHKVGAGHWTRLCGH
jgi:hypothetical protein